MEGNRHPLDKLLEEMFEGAGLANTLGISIERKTPEEVAAMVKAKEEEHRKRLEEAVIELAGITGALNKELKKNKLRYGMRKELLVVFIEHFLGGRS